MAAVTGRESDKFMLRLPDGMRDRVKAAADANNRSMNAEIIATLEEKYPAREVLADQLLTGIMRHLQHVAEADGPEAAKDRCENANLVLWMSGVKDIEVSLLTDIGGQSRVHMIAMDRVRAAEREQEMAKFLSSHGGVKLEILEKLAEVMRLSAKDRKIYDSIIGSP